MAEKMKNVKGSAALWIWDEGIYEDDFRNSIHL